MKNTKKNNLKHSKPLHLKDLKQDRIFKYYFKKYKQDLIHLLNSFLPLPQGQQIKQIKLLEEQLQTSQINKKESILDIHVDLDKQGIANVEMQNFPEKHFNSRTLFYASRLYGSQLGRGKKYELLKPVYSLLICTKSLFPELKEYYSTFSLRSDKDPDVLWTRDFNIVLVQLDRFRKDVDDLIDKVDNWCYILKNAPKMNKGEFSSFLSKGEEFKDIMWHLRKLSRDETAKVFEEHREKMWKDEQARLDGAYEKGMERGIEKGRDETALRMLAKKIDISTISKFTGLPKQKVERLKNKKKV